MTALPASLLHTLIACFAISLLALIGLVSLFFAGEAVDRALVLLVSFAAGALVGAAFFHLIPEALAQNGSALVMVVVGIVSFFALELFFYVYHYHLSGTAREPAGERGTKPVGILSLLSDGVHNMTDGLIIASSFLVSTNLGIVTAVVAALHEIPQELGNYAILLHAGYGRIRALMLNYLVALTIFIGAIGLYLLAGIAEGVTRYTVPFTAGGFIYIAAADLLPEVKEARRSPARKLIQFASFLLGITLLWLLRIWSE